MEENFVTQQKESASVFNPLASKVIPVIEEHIQIGKEVVETGRIHFFKKVLEEIYDAEVQVFKEEVIVERIPLNQYVDTAPGIRLDGDITIIPVVREVIVKRLLLVEELRISKKVTEQNVPIHEVLRKETVSITRTDKSDPDEVQL